jgi:hypothetical protein
MAKLYKYATNANEKSEQLKNVNSVIEAVKEEVNTEMPKESHVGAAMSDLTNRRSVFSHISSLVYHKLHVF